MIVFSILSFLLSCLLGFVPRKPIQSLTPPSLLGYAAFAVTSFAEGSEVTLRKNGQVALGSDVALKFIQPS